jgi:hypothetical protein
MSFSRIAAGALAGLWLCSLLGCGLEPASRRCGTEVPDPEDKDLTVAGCVEGPDQQPAVAARVIALPSSASHGGGVDGGAITQVTDKNGRFSFGKELAPGDYNLYFQDSASDSTTRPVQRLQRPFIVHGLGQVFFPSIRLAPPTTLNIVVWKRDTLAPDPGAVCTLDSTPFPPAVAGQLGIANFFVPRGHYRATCTDPSNSAWRSIDFDVDSGNTTVQQNVYLTVNGVEPDPLPPPADFAGSYDENSGTVELTWSPVNDARLLMYGIQRVIPDSGGGGHQYTTYDLFYHDAAFNRGDSEQTKNLLYYVYSLKRDPGGFNGRSRTQSFSLEARRPWAYGPRIDTLAPLDSGSRHAGDTLRIVGAWTNRLRENDSLYWRVSGPANLRKALAHPAAIGKDTLAFPLPDTGTYQISLTIRDADGYRSWLSLPLHF